MKRRLVALGICFAMLTSTISIGTVKAEETAEQPELQSGLPKIVSIELDKNEQSVLKDDKITISIEVEEGEEEREKLDSLQVELNCEGEKARTLTLDARCFNAESGKYEFEFPALENSSGEIEEQRWCVDTIVIKNRAESEREIDKEQLRETTEQGGGYKYWYLITEEADTDVDDSTGTEETKEDQTKEKAEAIQQVQTDFDNQEGEVGKYKVTFYYTSTDDTLEWRHEKVIQYMNKGVTIGEAVRQAEKKGTPERNYPGLQFKEWSWQPEDGQTADTLISGYTTIKMDAVYDNVVLSCNYSYLGKNGERQSETRNEIVEKTMTLKAVRERVLDYRLPDSVYPDLSFNTWKSYRPFEDSTITVGEHAQYGVYKATAKPDYTKGIIHIEYKMADGQGKGKTVNKIIMADFDITCGEVANLCESIAPDAEYKKLKRDGWAESVYNGNDSDNFFAGNSSYEAWVTLEEKYKDYGWVNFGYHSLQSNGDDNWIMEAKLYPYGMKFASIVEEGINTSLKPEFEELRFKGWNCPDAERLPETFDGTYYSRINLEPLADNCVVQYFVLKLGFGSKGSELIQAFAVEKGTLIAPPINLGQYKNIAWFEPNRVVVQDAITDFVGEENTLDYTKGNPDVSNPATTIYLPQDLSDSLVQQINLAKAGDKVECQMGNATILSQQILEAMAEKDVNVEFSMENGAVWSVNGMSVRADGLKDTNLFIQKYDKDKGPIPTLTMNKTAGELPANQLDLVHDGEFEFDAQLTLDVDAILNEKKGILLWHNNGTMQLEDSAIVNGSKVDFDFVHGSEYAVVYAMNGDVDNDGKITIRDMMRVLHHISSYQSLDALRQGIADVDMNNKVNIQDLMRLLHVVSGSSSGV